MVDDVEDEVVEGCWWSGFGVDRVDDAASAGVLEELSIGTIVFKTAPGLKLAASTLGRAVAFEVDALDGIDRTGISVVIRGHVRPV